MVEKHERYRPKVSASFNMAILDLQRIDSVLAAIDNIYMQCSNGDFASLVLYSSSLRALYKYFKPLLMSEQRDRYERNFQEIERKLLIEKKFTWSMFKEIEVLHEELMDTRQAIGLGMPVNVEDMATLKELKPEYGGYWQPKNKKKKKPL